MAGEDVFKVEGIIMEAWPNRTYQVELPNGHRVRAYVTGKARLGYAAVPGQKVTLQLSPYDLSQGRILAGTEKI